jgi:hypothetical protein
MDDSSMHKLVYNAETIMINDHDRDPRHTAASLLILLLASLVSFL